ncbi:cell division regulator GpsB [Bombilactobacillus folatiphilus]|uniref:Cell division regulator GpsB n=1 Tax=Bombilactobacillus folatiphilus TaxID=2923362 RepID=A0ABY4P6W4_9LACO|nr:cell division regulator GpsB [Bombilactobacillus folatiphilus]UQS81478.1 cell division regulator GpsB [Bombilactobacillus folatiphilus]
MKEIKLSPKIIVEKRFKNAVHGYNGKDVDSFLDEIIKDYEAFQANIDELKEENHRLARQLEEKRSVVTTSNVEPKPSQAVEPQVVVNENSAPGTTNYDILKRLSNLERHVFGQSVEPRTNYTSTSNSNMATGEQQPIINSSEQLHDQK